jgi:glycerol-3-phosphate acyltransferase PlsY
MYIPIFGLSLIGFFLGSIPFSMVVTHLIKHVDVRLYGDGNPGAANAFVAGGRATGILALFLDFLKGCLPVLFAIYYFHVADGWIIPIALAPIAGHAYSPFLGFKGGKAVAVTFGIWTGLTLFQAPLLLGGFCALFLFIFQSTAWATILSFLLFLVIFPFIHFDPFLVMISLINFGIILQKHYSELVWPIIRRRM